MRVPSSAGASSSQNCARGFFHPYSPASPASGTWLFSESSEESSFSAGDSLLTDDGVHPISASFKRGSRQPPHRLALYPTPRGSLPPSINEYGCPTVAQYLAVETSYIQDHAPARRQKALLSYESMTEIAQALAHYNEPPQLQDGRYLLSTLPTTGIMATAAMRHWARSKFTLSHDGVVLCKGKQVLVREQFYSALCWAHIQSAHGGRDKTSRMLWRYAGVPKELIMRFVASCPTCIDKTTAIRRTMMNTAARTDSSEPTSDKPEALESPTRAPSPEVEQTESLSLPPLREVLSTIFKDNDQLQIPQRVPSVLDSPTNFSPVGSAFDKMPSPPQGYVVQHIGYTGVSTTLDSAEAAPLNTLPALQHILSQLNSPVPPAFNLNAQGNGWENSPARANDSEEVADDSCVSDDRAYPTTLDYSSSPYAQTPARDALMFSWSAAPMQRQAATEGVGLSPPSSPLMRRYARLASPAFEDSPSATAHLLDDSSATGGISGWSPSSAPSASPAVAETSQLPSPVFNTAFRLYDTPLRRFSNRTFQQRWEAMYSARDVDMSYLPDLSQEHSLEGAEGYAIMVDDDSSDSYVSLMDEKPLSMDVARVEESSHVDSGSLMETPSIDMPYAALGFVHKPIGRARAHSNTLGLALQTDFSAEGAPTPPLTATSTLTAASPMSPGLETPAHSLFMQTVLSGKSDGHVNGSMRLESIDENMLPWSEGLPTESDPLAPHNMLHDWINMDYVQEDDGQLKIAGDNGAGSGINVA